MCSSRAIWRRHTHLSKLSFAVEPAVSLPRIASEVLYDPDCHREKHHSPSPARVGRLIDHNARQFDIVLLLKKVADALDKLLL